MPISTEPIQSVEQGIKALFTNENNLEYVVEQLAFGIFGKFAIIISSALRKTVIGIAYLTMD